MGAFALMLKKLFNCLSKISARLVPTKTPGILRKTMDLYGSIEGATKRTAYKSSRGFFGRVNGLIHRRNFSDRNTSVNSI
jgi:hypothetical protein